MHPSEDRRFDRHGAAGARSRFSRLFGRTETAVFPPPGIDRRAQLLCRDVAVFARGRAALSWASRVRAAAPSCLFLRALQTLLSGAHAPRAFRLRRTLDDPADPYLTVLAYFNALRELGAARRIVEDEIREHVASYGSGRVRHDPPGRPFADRALRQPVELTSRVSTDDVAIAKEKLGLALREADGASRDDAVDVALATNMISVGLDITRLGLMVVQGQPKTTAEYIQATSRVGAIELTSQDWLSRCSTYTSRATELIMSSSAPFTPPSIAPWRQPASRHSRRAPSIGRWQL